MRTTYSAFGLEVPQDTLESLNLYIEHGLPTGGFLEAVINNDLCQAIGRADEKNMLALPAIVSYLYNEAPMGSWGMPNSFEKWIEHIRLVKQL